MGADVRLRSDCFLGRPVKTVLFPLRTELGGVFRRRAFLSGSDNVHRPRRPDRYSSDSVRIPG